MVGSAHHTLAPGNEERPSLTYRDASRISVST